jgi:hypothetical protein
VDDIGSTGSILEAPEQQQQQQHGPGRSSGGGHYQLHRWDSAGSESKLPRYLTGGGSSSWGRLWLLLQSLDWAGFVKRFAGMTTRGMLILSTYTSANLVAASGGTIVMAAHQVRVEWECCHFVQGNTNLLRPAGLDGRPPVVGLRAGKLIVLLVHQDLRMAPFGCTCSGTLRCFALAHSPCHQFTL